MTTGSMASDWYYSKRGDPARQQIGPLDWEQFYAFAQGGTLTPDDLVWNPQFADWVPAGQVLGLFPAAAQPAPQSPYQPSAQARAAFGQAAHSNGRRRSWLLWVVPLAVLIVVGVGLGAYFGFLRGGGGANSIASSTTTVANETTSSTIAVTGIQGRAYYAGTKEPIVGATVRLNDSSSACYDPSLSTAETTTNAEGNYSFMDIVAGTYEVGMVLTSSNGVSSIECTKNDSTMFNSFQGVSQDGTHLDAAFPLVAVSTNTVVREDFIVTR
jgi:hypothetical protein